MILNHIQRPLVVFNPANRDHRQYYAEFLKFRTWGRCPVRFAISGAAADTNNLTATIERMLAEYYIGLEFLVVVPDIVVNSLADIPAVPPVEVSAYATLV